MADLNADQINADAELEASPQAETDTRTFENLSLAELIGQLLRRPGSTFSALTETLRSEDSFYDKPVQGGASATVIRVPQVRRSAIEWEQFRPLALLGGLLLIALVGSFILVSSRGTLQDGNLFVGGLLLLFSAAGITYLTAIDYHLLRLPPLKIVDETPAGQDFFATHGLRIMLVGMALVWGAGSWFFNTNNKFTTIGVVCWIMSVVTLIAALLDRNLYLGYWVNKTIQWIRSLPKTAISFRLSWTIIALAIILIVGAWFRLGNLDAYPVDMTSDHVEKLLDAVKVYEGERPIFFPNNGGRESFQMYYLAVLKTVTGLPFNFDLLKLGTALEGMVMILLAYWMGRAVLGEEDKTLGNITGLCMAALVATSYWHTMLSRLGLRIVTTTLIVTIVFIFLARALRHNRRTDWIIAGFALGAGMYGYQAVRMLPLVVIVGFILAVLIRARSRRALREYFGNMVALVAVSLMVFIPLGHYMLDNPADFWERTTGRLFGESYVTNNGEVTAVPFDQRWAAFQKNLPGLLDNFAQSALMFNWKGDRSWFHGEPDGIPALDFFAGALFVSGLGITFVRFWKRRDPVDLLLPISIMIMILPSALALAFTIEVPDFTRGSGAFPMVYLIAALALAFLLQLALHYLPSMRVRRITIGLAVVLLVLGAIQNYNSYFVEAMSNYRLSTLPYKQVGQILGGFVNSTGAPGNAFMVAYPYWMDHRAIGIESGDDHWNNTLSSPDDFPNRLFDIIRANFNTKYELHPDRYMMFILNQDDTAMTDKISQLFPGGTLMSIASYNQTRDFKIYVSPPVGCDWVIENLRITLPACTNQVFQPGDVATTPEPSTDATPPTNDTGKTR
jgi:hypothetical protein